MSIRKRHPCSKWCEQRLHGIVDNLRLRGEIEQDFQVDFEPIRIGAYIPKDVFTLKCQHGRMWKIVDISDVKA